MLHISKWMIATMTKDALEELVEKTNQESEVGRMAREELESRPAKANGNSVKNIEDYC